VFLLDEELVTERSPVAKTVIHGSDFGHDGINTSNERCGICLNPPCNVVVLLVILVLGKRLICQRFLPHGGPALLVGLVGQRFLCRLHSAFGRLAAVYLCSQRFLCHLCSTFGRLLAVYLRGESVLEALYLGEVELRRRCGGLAATAFRSRLR
jgi:hypothetical protein